MRILHAAAEYLGLAKTGGLADAVSALVMTQHEKGDELRVCVPGYRSAWQQLDEASAQPRRIVAELTIAGVDVSVVECRLQSDGPLLWLIDAPALFDRPGTPYSDDEGCDFADNGRRFGSFGLVVARLAQGAASWRPAVVHLHDWHCGLAALHLSGQDGCPQVLFTIHNLAYQGVFGADTLRDLLPPEADPSLPTRDTGAIDGELSFMRAGLIHSDTIVTVSPRYAQEIQTPGLGCGLDDLLRANRHKLHGIVNGIDMQRWNPATDKLIEYNYDADTAREGKAANKRALQRELGLQPLDVPLLIFVGRLDHQKGIDLIARAWQWLASQPLQLVILGRGDPALEQQCRQLTEGAGGRVSVQITFDEQLAHRLTAAADLQLLPSRFEPCGLSQMYAQRYGTIPVARRTGGFVDTIVDASDTTLADSTATGVLFDAIDPFELFSAVMRGIALVTTPAMRQTVIDTGMRRDFSWQEPAARYEALYQSHSATSDQPPCRSGVTA